MQQQFTPYQQGLTPQQQYTPAPQQRPAQQSATKFYKSGLFFIASASGRLMRDVGHMERQGWHLQYAASLGRNVLLRQVIVTVWIRE